MRTILFTTVTAGLLFFLSGCVVGNYVSSTTGETKVSQAPLKLKLLRNARWTYYAYTNSAAFMYYENARYRKRGDTIYMRARTYFGDTNTIDKQFFPQFVVSGDSLKSLHHNVTYVKAKK